MLPRFVITIGLIAACLVSPRAQQAPAEAPPAFRSAADIVTIHASVRDGRGRIVGGLTATDFEVRDNGTLQPILSLRSDHQSPLSVAILVDMSGSMQLGAKTTMARQAYASLLSQLRQGQDEVALFTFDAAHERQDFTRELGKLNGALADFQPFGSTSLYDATAATARRLAARPGTHKAIVVLTDGIDTSSTMSARTSRGWPVQSTCPCSSSRPCRRSISVS